MKWLLIGFIIIQVGVDLAHSVTAFPFVHYGMFSEKFGPPDSLAVYAVTVNDKLLQARDFSVYRWDMIQSPLEASEKQRVSRDFEFDREKMAAGFSRAGMTDVFTLVAPHLVNDKLVAEAFVSWYRQYLSGLLGHPVHTLRVEKVWYRWNAGRMQPYTKEIRINQ
ncbi:MAG: hypothetical protein JST42_29710 [Bacteroidetes bacterium]|nr:hypothetical protein [Bacteroidota bacterium]